jgi:hypothetical protein
MIIFKKKMTNLKNKKNTASQKQLKTNNQKTQTFLKKKKDKK